MVECMEAISAALKACGAKNINELCDLVGATKTVTKVIGRSAVKSSLHVPETGVTRYLRYPGPFFLYNCEDPPGCPVQKCSTLTDCAKRIWGGDKPTEGHETTIRAFEDSNHKGVERPFLYKVYGPDKTAGVKGWQGYGGEKNPTEVLEGKACPNEVSEQFRWKPSDLDEWKKEHPDIGETKPLTIRLVSKNPSFTGSAKAPVTTAASVTQKEVSKKTPAKKEEKVTGIQTGKRGQGKAGDFVYFYTISDKGTEKAPFYTDKGVEIPEPVFRQLKASALETAKLRKETAEREAQAAAQVVKSATKPATKGKK